jgi:transcriptional regulator with XRE-family HTH domain
MRLGKLLRLYRLLEGTRTTRELGAEIGISASTISRIENGKPCDMHSLGKLITWLITDDEGTKELIG